MCMFISCAVQEMVSSPPATYTSPSLAMMRCAARAMVCRPDEQKRFTVMPDTVMGQPARRAAWRAMLAPLAPSGVPQPMMTSSTSAASIPARWMACSITWPPSVAPCVMLKAPFQLLVKGVRAVDTITADVMLDPCSVVWLVAYWKVLPSAASLASSGAGFQNAASSSGFLAKRFMACTTLNRPTSLA